MSNDKKLQELKQNLNKFQEVLILEYKSKIESLTKTNGEFSMDKFNKNKINMYNLISEYNDKYINSKEFLDVNKEEMRITFDKFATFCKVSETFDKQNVDVVEYYKAKRG